MLGRRGREAETLTGPRRMSTSFSPPADCQGQGGGQGPT